MEAPAASRFPFIETSKESLRLYNDTVGTARLLPFSFRDETYHLHFIQEDPSYEAQIYFKIKEDEKVFWMGLSPLLPISTFKTDLSNVSLKDLPPDVAAMLLESLSAELFESLEKSLRAKLSLEAIRFEHPEDPFDHVLYFNILDTSGQIAYSGHFSASSFMLEYWVSHLKATPSQEKTHFEKAPYTGLITAGRTTLSRSDFNNLHPNDIILLDDGEAFKNQILTLRFSPQLAFKIQYNNGTATVTHMTDIPEDNPAETPESSAEEEMTAEVTKPQANTQNTHAPSINELPVHLTFEVGRKELSLSELKGIDQGYSFELESPTAKPVTIRANGTPVGFGELLDVAGKVGVRVIEFTH